MRHSVKARIGKAGLVGKRSRQFREMRVSRQVKV
jgi:hypothetical protein